MNTTHQYSIHTITSKTWLSTRWLTMGLLLLGMLAGNLCFAGEDPEYDETEIFVSVPGVGSFQMPAVIAQEIVYLPVNTLFDYLKIKNTVSAHGDSVYGYYLQPDNHYIVDCKWKRIVIKDKVIPFADKDVIRTETAVYLRGDYFTKAFGLTCRFNFRSLTVVLTSAAELPIVREIRQASMRNNLMSLTGQIKADTAIGKKQTLFNIGTADWSAITTQVSEGKANNRFNLTLGAVLAGGETTLGLNYDSYLGFRERQQYYLWRYVNNDCRVIKQVMAGKIASQSVSSIFSPVVGLQFTNTPSTYRRSFGSYVLSDRTEPNWLVELYVNNVLVNYVRADAAGFFSFDVPLVYGSSAVQLRFYGPYGEERTTTQNIHIPFNFVPAGKLEYTVSAGVVEDSLRSRYAKASFYYGAGKRLTIGAGLEYLSSVTTGKYMPFLNGSLRITSGLLLNSEWVYGVRSKQLLSYRLPSNLQVELSYTRYKKGQKAINNTFLEERKAMVSLPFRSSRFSLYSRFTVYQIVLPASKLSRGSAYTNMEALFSGVCWGVNTNLTTYVLFTGGNKAYYYSNLSATIRLTNKILFTPQAQFEYNSQRFISVKGEAGKYLSAKGYANIFYERNFKSGYEGVGIGIRYDLPFAQASLASRRANKVQSHVIAVRGSLLYSKEAGYFNASTRPAVGKGGVHIVPFLDLNGNGIQDKDEPRAYGLKVQISSGRLMYDRKDTAVLITDLEAYQHYTIKLSAEGFDNIAWYIKNRVLSVEIGPNSLNTIAVPVNIAGEVTGTIFKEQGHDKRGLGRILVKIYREGQEVAKTMTEMDGFFSITGLAPGTYRAEVDADQLHRLQLKAVPAFVNFTIRSCIEGGLVEGLAIILQEQ